MSESRDRKNMKFGVILSYVSMVVSFLCTLLFTNRILDSIGDYNYGLYAFVGSITAWLTVASSALTASYLRFTSLEEANNKSTGRTNTIYLKVFSIIGAVIVSVGLLVGSVMFLCKNTFAGYSWEDSKVIYALFALSILNIGVTTVATVFRMFIVYKGRFIFEKSLSIFVVLLNHVGQFVVALYTHNIVYLSGYVLTVAVLNVICEIFYSKKHCKISFLPVTLSENKGLIKSIAFFSGILLVNSIVDQINSNVDKTLLGIFSQPEKVTIYQLGMQFNSYLSIMVVAVSGVFAPRINKLVVNQKHEELHSLFNKVSRIQSIVVCCISFGFVACGKEFIIWWAGEGRVDAYYVGAILMLISIMPLAVKTSVDIQRAMNKHYFRSIMYFFVAIINIALSIMFLRLFPEEYAIFACLLGSVIASLITQWTAMNIFNYKVIKLPMKSVLLRLFVCIAYGVVATLAVKVVSSFYLGGIQSVLLKLFAEMFVFMLVYVAFLAIFERKFIIGFIKGNRN